MTDGALSRGSICRKLRAPSQIGIGEVSFEAIADSLIQAADLAERLIKVTPVSQQSTKEQLREFACRSRYHALLMLKGTLID